MSDDFKIQHSVKTREGDMLNVRAADAAEFEKVLSYVEENIGRIAGLGDLIRAVGTAGNVGLLPAQAPVADARASGGNVQSSQPANAPTCQHGAMTFRSGTSGKGPWKGYFCPTPKGTPGQCDPIFQR